MPTDTERLDWLEKQAGASLVSDDDGRWAVAMSGFAPMPTGNPETWPPAQWQGLSWVDRHEWRNSVRDAIDAAMRAFAEEIRDDPNR